VKQLAQSLAVINVRRGGIVHIDGNDVDLILTPAECQGSLTLTFSLVLEGLLVPFHLDKG